MLTQATNNILEKYDIRHVQDGVYCYAYSNNFVEDDDILGKLLREALKDTPLISVSNGVFGCYTRNIEGYGKDILSCLDKYFENKFAYQYELDAKEDGRYGND